MKTIDLNYFIIGTDTNVGKTFFTEKLTIYLRTHGYSTIAIKPLASGTLLDTEKLYQANSSFPENNGNAIPMFNEITPFFFQKPVAPFVCANEESRSIEPKDIIQYYRDLKRRYSSILVEGIGGWMVPINRTYYLANLVKDFNIPVILVIRNRIGSLNHTFLTLESIRSHGVQCAGLVLNEHPDDRDDYSLKSNKEILSDIGFPILSHLKSEFDESVFDHLLSSIK